MKNCVRLGLRKCPQSCGPEKKPAYRSGAPGKHSGLHGHHYDSRADRCSALKRILLHHRRRRRLHPVRLPASREARHQSDPAEGKKTKEGASLHRSLHHLAL